MSTKILMEMERSLQPKPSAKPVPKPVKADNLLSALLLLPTVEKKLDALIKERKRTNDLYSGYVQVDFDIKRLSEKTGDNLQQIKVVEQKVVDRLKALDGLEAKYLRMIENVNNVLVELERVLKTL